MTDASLQQNLQHASRTLNSAAELTAEFKRELKAIGNWWTSHAFDEEAGGFYGEVHADNTPIKDANKGIVLNTRILWFFSEAAMATDAPEYRAAATRAYEYQIGRASCRERVKNLVVVGPLKEQEDIGIGHSVDRER